MDRFANESIQAYSFTGVTVLINIVCVAVLLRNWNLPRKVTVKLN